MKRMFKFYCIVWVALLVLFNVISFISVGWAGQEKYTPSFWLGYVFISLSFVGQLFCAYFAFKNDALKKTFYNISLFTTSCSGLILSFVVGGLCMLISPLPDSGRGNYLLDFFDLEYNFGSKSFRGR